MKKKILYLYTSELLNEIKFDELYISSSDYYFLNNETESYHFFIVGKFEGNHYKIHKNKIIFIEEIFEIIFNNKYKQKLIKYDFDKIKLKYLNKRCYVYIGYPNNWIPGVIVWCSKYCDKVTVDKPGFPVFVVNLNNIILIDDYINIILSKCKIIKINKE